MPSLRIISEIIELPTRHPFHIARAAAPPVRRSVWFRLIDEAGAEGWGEAAANAYYGESVDTVLALVPTFEEVLKDSTHDITSLESLERSIERAVRDNPAARVAISAALHDLVGKRLGVPVWRLWGLDPLAMPASSFTLGLDTAEAVLQKLEEAASYPILKMKVGSSDDRRLLELVREAAPDKRVRIDANTGWTVDEALALLPALEELDIELIEQPFPADDLDSFRRLRGRSRIPIIADESCRVATDIPRLAGAVDGINIKLEKCGSLREALRMVHVARAHDMHVMLGCMLSTTLAMAAAMQLAPLVDFVDLDGAALLAHDPFSGPHLRPDGQLVLNEAPGLGVTRRS